MPDFKMYRLTTEDAVRLEELAEKVNAQAKKQGMRIITSAVMLRALILNGQKTKMDDLIEAIKQAKIFV